MKLFRFIIVALFFALIGAIITLAATFPYKHKLEAENKELRVAMETQDGRRMIRYELFPQFTGKDSIVLVYDCATKGE
jgi:hypothetical protein